MLGRMSLDYGHVETYLLFVGQSAKDRFSCKLNKKWKSFVVGKHNYVDCLIQLSSRRTFIKDTYLTQSRLQF